MKRLARAHVVTVALPVLFLGAPRPALAQATVTVLDTFGTVGANPSIAIGTDGLGLIAYYDATFGDLKVAHCDNTVCATATLSTIDSPGDVGLEASLAIGADGRGIISYRDYTSGLKAAHCNDVPCTSATVTVVDPTKVQGRTSIAIGSDGLPLITYVRGVDQDAQLASAHCSNVACSAATVSPLRPVLGGSNMDTAVAIGPDGQGLIAYVGTDIAPGPGLTISMAHCVDTTCTAVDSIGPVPPTVDAPLVGFTDIYGPSLFIGADGRGLVSYHRNLFTIPVESNTYEVVLHHCATTSCESFDSTRLIAVASNDAPNAPITMGASGLPRLVRAQSFKLRLAQCADAACSVSTDSCVIARGQETAMANGTDGFPLVAFQAFPDEDLAVVHGTDPCVPSLVSVQDLTIDEGDALSYVGVRVTLDTPTDETASVRFDTADVTAQAGIDYEAVSATLTFQGGAAQTSQTLFLPILGDTQHELDETFELVLSDPQGLTIGDGSGIVTLRNDDSAPTMALGDCDVTEGDTGTVGCLLDASLSEASGLPVTVDYATASGTAQAGVDYFAVAGTLSFAPGTTAQTISVSVVGDTAIELHETFFVNLSNPTNATLGDGQGDGLIVDDDAPPLSSLELTHGARVRADLAAAAGPAADSDVYRLAEGPYSSWEVVVDEVSGDIAPGLLLERLAEDNTTVLQTGTPVGTGSAHALRWQHRAAHIELRHHIRLSSTSCTTDCGTDDTYRLRVLETTGRIPRFNNAGTQVTVLILHNATDRVVQANADFWDANGVRRATVGVPLGPHAVGVVNTFGIPGLAGLSGSITVSHDAPFGALAGKAVALEPSTGFSFDSPLEYRPR